jgi:hypothetical protein
MRKLSRGLAALLLAAAVASAYSLPPDPTVYVVEKGKKYHKKNCRLKSGSKGMKLSLAKRKGFLACKVCKPPK